VHEVAQRIGADLVLNVQGDEPEVSPAAIDALVAELERGSIMATIACALTDAQKLARPNHVKVVCDRLGRALYFSRAPIPWHADGTPTSALLHLGVYGFQRATLERFASLGPSRLEQSERLEQLRALEHGIPIQVILSEHEFSGIDTPEDYAAFVTREKARRTGRGA
jgi:3-deoxy-manno-octulosonate cytidylyltransferase (CMP-KDO synthetase)